METKLEKITPELAGKYLKRNVDNYRRLNKSKVAQYAADMKAGKWQQNGEGIAFDTEGKLKNGQHRLAAILASGVTVEMNVTRGVADDVSIYDIGMNRNTRQIAQASGCAEISGVETAAGTALAGGFTRIPKGMALEYIQRKQDELRRAARICGGLTKRALSGRASAVIATMMQLYDGAKSYELEVFFKIFNSGNVVGADGYEPSPALVARRMIETGYRQKAADTKAQREQVEIFTLAMQDFRAGKTRQLNYKLQDPFKSSELMARMRKAHGLEV